MMFAILQHYGIPKQIVKDVRVLYEKSTSRIYVNDEVSKSFDVTTGVLQGDVLALFLFIIVIDYVSRLSAGKFGYLTHKGANTGGRSLRSATRDPERRVNDLALADDIAPLESQPLQKQLDALRTTASSVGLEINTDKTE